MKQFIVLILATIYLFSTAGVSVHFHYCMNRLVARNLVTNENDECGKCGMSQDGGCCKEESKFLKNAVDHKSVESQKGISPLKEVTAAISCSHADVYDSTHPFPIAFLHPPPLYSPPRYLSNRVIRI